MLPRGELRAGLLCCLRQGRNGRKRRSRGQDRRGRIVDMTSLHVRPPEVEDRLIPGHWEGDLIKGAFNRSAVGTLVERSSRLVMLAHMEGGHRTGGTGRIQPRPERRPPTDAQDLDL